MNKAQILKQTGLTEEQFYKLYPTREHYQMAMGGRLYADGGDIERPRPVVHTGTANNKSWVQSGLDYIGNLGVQDFSNNIQDIFFNPNKGVILDRNNPNISSIIPAVKNYNSSNIKPSYTQQYADGGNLAGNMGMTGVQNNDVKANNKYFTDAEAALAAFAENMPIVGSIVKAQNNRLSGAREQIDRKGGIGAGIGQAFSQAVDMGLGLVGGMKGNKRENTTESSLSKNADTLQSPSNINETLMNPVEGDTNVLGTLPNNAYGGRLNYGFGGSTDGKTPQYTKTASSALSYNPYVSNVSPVIGDAAEPANRVGADSNSVLRQASPYHRSPYGAYYDDKNISVNSYTKAVGGAITEINTGGTHEQNPMGGVMVGKNASVEQGESLINKDGKPAFVLTDRIKLDSATAEEFDLPKKYIGKTFSEIGKAENRVSDLRPEDPLTKDLLKSRNEKLEAAQEAQKARMAEKHMAKAQELAPEMFQQAQPQGMPQEQMPPQDLAMEQMMAMQGQGMPQGMPQQPMMASGGSLNFKSSGAYNKWLGYVHANKLAENTPGHQKVSIGGEPHKVQHGYGGVMQYAGGGPFDPIEPVMMNPVMMNTNTYTYPSIPSIQNVPTVSDPNALRDLQQRNRSFVATLNWEKNNGYNNYGFTSEPAGSINSLGQAHEKFMDNYQPMIDDLPVGLQGLVGDFAFNSEDPKASLMVSQGYLTPEEKIKLYKNGKLDNTAVDNLWKIHGKNVINDFNTDRVAFANNFDAERLRSYKNTKGADEKLPEWTQRVAASRDASGIPRTNPYLQPKTNTNTNTNTTNTKAVVDPLNPGGQSYTNPYRQSTVRDLFVGPQAQDQQGPPYSLFTNNNTNPDPNVTPDSDSGYYTREISNIPLPSDKYDKASLAMLGMNAIANLGAAANMRGPRTSGSVNFDRINTYPAEQAARMAANDAIANMRDATRNAGASQAQYIGNMPGNIAQIAANASGDITRLKLQGAQTNANIQMQEAMQNKNIEMKMKEIQDMSDAQRVNQISKISGKTVESVNEVMKGMSARERDLYTLQWMNQKNYGIATAEDAKKYGVKEGSYFYHAPKTDYTNSTKATDKDNPPTMVYDSQKGEWVFKVAYGGKISKKFGGKIKN